MSKSRSHFLRYRDLRTALLALLLAVITHVVPAAEPLRLEAQAGVCQYGQAGEGVWWNSNYSTDMDLRSFCWQLGVSRIERRYEFADVGWRVSWADLGRYRADNQFAAWDEDQFVAFDRGNCQRSGKNCVARGQMHGHAYGLTLTGITERHWQEVTFGLEAGAYVYYSYFDVTLSIPDHPDWQVPGYRWDGYTVRPVLGLTAQYGYLFATFRSYFNLKSYEHSCTSCTGVIGGPAWSALVGIQFPLW